MNCEYITDIALAKALDAKLVPELRNIVPSFSQPWAPLLFCTGETLGQHWMPGLAQCWPALAQA